jgi:hypothetical protein
VTNPAVSKTCIVAIFTLIIGLSGTSVIVFVEVTIKINNIDLTGATLSNTSQLIPFLVGLFTFLSVAWSVLKNWTNGEADQYDGVSQAEQGSATGQRLEVGKTPTSSAQTNGGTIFRRPVRFSEPHLTFHHVLSLLSRLKKTSSSNLPHRQASAYKNSQYIAEASPSTLSQHHTITDSSSRSSVPNSIAAVQALPDASQQSSEEIYSAPEDFLK